MLERDMRHEVIKRFKSVARVTPIESRETMRSIPNMQLRSRTADWWIELKHNENIRATPIEIPWRPGQRLWLRLHESMGGNVALIFSQRDWFYIFIDSRFMLDQYSSIEELKRYSINGFIENIPLNLWEGL